MKENQMKVELHQFIDQADDRMLSLIYALVQVDLEDPQIHG